MGTGSSLTLRAIGDTREMAFEADGGVVGARFQLRPSAGGYWGVSGESPVDLRTSGQRIIGVVGDRIVNLHLQVDGDAVLLQGLFAGGIGRLSADHQTISSWLGGCYYDLQLTGSRYQGQRLCRRRGLVEPVSIDASGVFEALPAERRAMLLALLLGA
jgi:hypothetical protein